MSCPGCGKAHKRSKNGPCPGCAGRLYRATPQGKRIHSEAKRRYERSEKGRATRKRYIRQYRLRTGEYLPEEVHALRKANKRLERALAATDNG